LEFWTRNLKEYSTNVLVVVECDASINTEPCKETPGKINLHIRAFHSESWDLYTSTSLATITNFLEHIFAHVSRKSSRSTITVYSYLFHPWISYQKFNFLIISCSCHVAVPPPSKLHQHHIYHRCLVASPSPMCYNRLVVSSCFLPFSWNARMWMQRSC
jgi:hypothetical protein